MSRKRIVKAPVITKPVGFNLLSNEQRATWKELARRVEKFLAAVELTRKEVLRRRFVNVAEFKPNPFNILGYGADHIHLFLSISSLGEYQVCRRKIERIQKEASRERLDRWKRRKWVSDKSYSICHELAESVLMLKSLAALSRLSPEELVAARDVKKQFTKARNALIRIGWTERELGQFDPTMRS